MRKAVLAMMVLLTACASGGSGGGSGPAAILKLAGSFEPTPPRDGSEYFVVDTVTGTPERAFNAVRLTYEALGFEFSYYEPDRQELGTFVGELREVEGHPPSAWIHCGQSVVAGDNANYHAITLAVGTRVLPLDARTSTVETVIRARSRPRDVSATVTRCATLGTLERRIADGARTLLARYGPGAG